MKRRRSVAAEVPLLLHLLGPRGTGEALGPGLLLLLLRGPGGTGEACCCCCGCCCWGAGLAALGLAVRSGRRVVCPWRLGHVSADDLIYCSRGNKHKHTIFMLYTIYFHPGPSTAHKEEPVRACVHRKLKP